MKKNKFGFAFFLIVTMLLMASVSYSTDKQEQGHRTLNVTVTKITGDTLFYKTEEGTTRNVALQIVEKYEKVDNVKVGDKLVMEFDEGNQVIRINRPDHFRVSGEVMKFDPVEKKVTLKLKDGTTQVYTMIPPAASKMVAVPIGTSVVLDIDMKNNFVKDFHRPE